MRHDTLRSMVLICKIGNILYPCCLKNVEKWKQGDDAKKVYGEKEKGE